METAGCRLSIHNVHQVIVSPVVHSLGVYPRTITFEQDVLHVSKRRNMTF